MIVSIKCCECGREISDKPYAFSGNFACEDCVRNYYKNNYSSDYDIEGELLSRHYEALKMMKVRI